MQYQNGEVRIQNKNFDEISEARNSISIELISINRKLDELDNFEIRKGALSKKQEIDYDLLVDRQIEIETGLYELES